MDMKQIIAGRIADAAKASFENCELAVADVVAMLETPPDKKLGDYALPCFRLAKTLRKAPPMIASALAEKIGGEEIDRVEVVGGYMNIFVSRGNMAAGIVEAVLKTPGKWGSSAVGEGKTVCLDYSSINIAKRFHIGHLSTTMIGHSLKRIYDFNGYTTVGINHLGDWGSQFGKMVAAYKLWGNREEVERGGVQAMVDLYVRFHAEAEKDPSLDDLGRAWFKKIEDGDEEALEIFSWFKAVTLKDTQRVYDLLGVSFDSYNGEAFYNDKMDPVVQELREKGLLVESQGAQVVSLDDYNMPPALVLRSDGATLYITRDLAAAFYRHNEYKFDKCLYVVAYQQNLHFKQLFKILDLMGHEWHKGMEHVSFGMVSYEGRALSTREGYVVYLEDLLGKAIEKAREIIEEKSPNLPNKDEVARQVGVGAVVYFDLHNERIKDIDFRWDRALSFEGETGPYVQYTHARCCSVLRKAEAYKDAQPNYDVLCDDEALEVLMQLSRFPETVRKAMDQNEPCLITRHVTSLAQAYNKYYFEHRIMDEGDAAGTAARVRLTDAVRDVIKTGLYLIGVEAPERM
ncbi:MAG: arginine--tRNA ligase [Clostridiales bacterium]|nr:arginine--tRNA ligase [Clostridiales bacterium]